jgi:arylesterase/paraoxonase
MRIAAIIAGLFFLAAITATIGLYSFNHFRTIERSFAGRCTPVTGVVGPEDIQTGGPGGLTFISSLDRRSKSARGGVHVFDLDDPLAESFWRDRTGGAPEAFRPLGLDYYEDANVRRLFVVNQANKSVELFDVMDDGELVYLETFSERRMTSPNNIVAVGPRSFYVTNDVRPGRGSMLAELHFLMRTPSGQVLYTDGVFWRVAAEGLRFANGIDISPDGREVYVAETAGQSLQVFNREATTGDLTPERTIKLNTAPDNINVDSAGTVWIAAMPRPLDVPRLFADRKARAPSEVMRINPMGEPETVYLDDGVEISASTVAARVGRKLLIGALYEEKFLICDLPDGSV